MMNILIKIKYGGRKVSILILIMFAEIEREKGKEID